jgi:hypothetical protein
MPTARKQRRLQRLANRKRRQVRMASNRVAKSVDDIFFETEETKYYGRDGWPMNFAVWLRCKEDDNYRVVRCDRIADMEISTVWLGRDEACFGGPPLIFETMIFGGSFDCKCWRYSTEEEAIAGHMNAVRVVLSQVPGMVHA